MWIKVKEKKPRKKQRVLLQHKVKRFGYFMGTLEKTERAPFGLKEAWSIDGHDYYQPLNNYTHWQLPQPPKEE